MMFQVEFIRDETGLSALANEWQELWKSLGEEATVFSSFDWYQTWWKHFGQESDLFVVTARCDGALVGIAPLMCENSRLRGLPVRVLRFIENGNSLHNDFILQPDKRQGSFAAIMAEIESANHGYDLLELKNIPHSSPNAALFNSWLDNRSRQVLLKKGLDSPVLQISDDWDTFFATRTTRTRKTLRNINNRFEKNGSWEIYHIESFADFEKHLDDFLSIARNSWTEEVGDSLWSPRNRDFFTTLASVASERGWLNAWLLTLDSNPVAFEFHLCANRKVHGLRASFDDEYASLSPGAFLDFHVVQNYFRSQEGLQYYDFGGSFDAYKRKWTEDTVSHVWALYFKGGFYSRFIQFIEGHVIPFAKNLRSFKGNRI